MSWTGFKYDVFISYARVDNQVAVGNPEEKGWVSLFHSHLKVALSREVGLLDAVKIWRDTREIKGNQLFDSTIQEAIDNSAVFLALDSSGYHESAYCHREIQHFYDKARQDPVGLAAGDQHRIFHLLLKNTPPSNWPAQVGGTSGFEFYESDGAEPADPEGKRFHECVRRLVNALYETLKRLRDRGHAEPVPKAQEQPAVSIYLAGTSDSLDPTRRRVLADLAQYQDLKLIDGVPPPFEPEPHDQRVIELVRQVDFSVHLLNEYPGKEIQGREGLTYPQRQVELALEHGKSQLIWVPRSVEYQSIEDERYAAFLSNLENGKRSRPSYSFVRDLRDAIPRQIRDKANKIPKPPSMPVIPTIDAVLLDTHVKDQLYAINLSNYLADHGLRTYINPEIDPEEDKPSGNLDEFTERLKKVGILILFYGEVAETWIRARLAKLFSIAMLEGCPVRAWAVYVAPPRKSAQNVPSLPLISIEWMDHTAGFNSGAIDHLLDRARAMGA